MEFDLNYLEDLNNDIGSCSSSLEGSFNSSWDDSVHDSFNEFMQVFQESVNKITELASSIPTILEPLKEVNSKKLKEECTRLMSMIEEI